MEVDKDVRSLASYVTYRQLYDEGRRDVYYIISQFVENVIITQKLYTFGVTEVAEQIRCQFGFDIPDYVVQSSLKRLSYIERENHSYIVHISLLPKDRNFVSDSIKKAAGKNKKLMDELIRYVEKKRGTLSELEILKLTREFCSFLLDSFNPNGYSEIISAFILENENNENFHKHIMQIKEGAVLFAGLNYNSNISDNSAWKEEIIIYVENEILFHLAGYNGTVFQKLAEELFNLINEMNTKSKKRVIKIRYFEEVLDEINSFFDKAVQIVEGKDHITVDNYAMAEIVKGCSCASDIIGKKSKFNLLLGNYAITKAEKYDYYSENNHEYNLESPEAIVHFQISDEKIRYIKHLNYVNILRKNVHSRDLKRSKYIVLTETGKMLRMASELLEEQAYAPLAINMNILTNRLWYDLNKGFGSNVFPATFDIVIKSRIVLSKILTQNIADKYDEAKKKYQNCEINEEQLADNILLLREEIKRPEDIKVDNLDDVLSFMNEEKLEIYKSEKEFLENELKKSKVQESTLKASMQRKDEENKQMQKNAEQKQAILQNRNIELSTKHKNELLDRIADYKKRKERADKKVNKQMKVFKALGVFSIIIYYIIVFYIYISSNSNIQSVMSLVLSIAPPGICLIISVISEKNFNILEVYKNFMKYVREYYEEKVYKEYSIDSQKIIELELALKEINVE